MLECCRQDTKEAMICIDNKYALIQFTSLYQIVGSQARAFLQPTRANIHQYQFNNPILLYCIVSIL